MGTLTRPQPTMSAAWIDQQAFDIVTGPHHDGDETDYRVSTFIGGWIVLLTWQQDALDLAAVLLEGLNLLTHELRVEPYRSRDGFAFRVVVVEVAS